ncbi:DnaJ domain-containing protein, partial [Patescibacteria group bacterium]|nr:DnaJ domain-containing protein [Patescibacteria group bacterium]
MKDYYKILGVSKDATQEDIKKAYRKLAHKYHPDKGGSGDMFKEVSEAYQILSDRDKKSQYDKFGQVFDGEATPPTVTTAYVLKLSGSGETWFLGGKVGIGKTNLSYDLDVEGSIKASDSFVFSDSSTQAVAATPNGFSWSVSTAVHKQ